MATTKLLIAEGLWEMENVGCRRELPCDASRTLALRRERIDHPYTAVVLSGIEVL